MTPSALSSGTISALLWLAQHEDVNGSYGAYAETYTAAAASAFYLTSPSSTYGNLALSWLAKNLNSSPSWYWGTEADYPGAILYSLATSSHISHLNLTFIKNSLLQFQLPSGGFFGYYDLTLGPVASSVDTDMALLGLINSNLLPASNQTNAVDYLHSLQNSDGSFNLTSTTPFNSVDSLGPDPVSMTALTVLALHAAGYSRDDPYVSSGLAYLNTQSAFNFGGHEYGASLVTLAFEAYGESGNAIVASEYVLSKQNADGGFNDTSRSPSSNALDTGWAVAALHTGFMEESKVAPLNSAPIASFVFGPSSITIGTSVQFNASSSHDTDGDQLSYLWTFGDGTIGSGVSPRHTYTQSGNYTVTLTVTDSGTNPADLSTTRSQNLSIQPSNLQNTSKLPVGFGIARAIILLVAAIAIIIGIGVYIVLQRNKRPN